MCGFLSKTTCTTDNALWTYGSGMCVESLASVAAMSADASLPVSRRTFQGEVAKLKQLIDRLPQKILENLVLKPAPGQKTSQAKRIVTAADAFASRFMHRGVNPKMRPSVPQHKRGGH